MIVILFNCILAACCVSLAAYLGLLAPAFELWPFDRPRPWRAIGAAVGVLMALLATAVLR